MKILGIEKIVCHLNMNNNSLTPCVSVKFRNANINRTMWWIPSFKQLLLYEASKLMTETIEYDWVRERLGKEPIEEPEKAIKEFVDLFEILKPIKDEYMQTQKFKLLPSVKYGLSEFFKSYSQRHKIGNKFIHLDIQKDIRVFNDEKLYLPYLKIHFAPNKNKNWRITPAIDLKFKHKNIKDVLSWRPSFKEILIIESCKLLCEAIRRPKESGNFGEDYPKWAIYEFPNLFKVLKPIADRVLSGTKLKILTGENRDIENFFEDFNKTYRIPRKCQTIIKCVDDRKVNEL